MGGLVSKQRKVKTNKIYNMKNTKLRYSNFRIFANDENAEKITNRFGG